MAMIDSPRIDSYLWRMFNEYDGFKFKSSSNEAALRIMLAQYAADCLHDTELAKEALDILGKGENNAKV
jgi:hypothetical protein